MSVTSETVVGKTFSQVRELAEQLCSKLQAAVTGQQSFYELETLTLTLVLQIGKAGLDAVLKSIGNGDLGATVDTEVGQQLQRSDQPQPRQLRSIFGVHQFQQYVYSTGAKRRIELRPVEARLQLTPRTWSQLLEEFSQLFCVETAFGQAAKNLERVFGQPLSVATLEAVSQRMGADAAEYSASLPTPPSKEEGEILVATQDGKGVPLIQEEPARTKAFETRKLRPGNRRVATIAGAYSVDRYVRTARDVVAALFRDASEKAPAPRPRPCHKHLSVHFPQAYDVEGATVYSTGGIEAASWLAEEVAARRQDKQPLVALGDGDPNLWAALAEHLPTDRVEILDIVHVSSYVWEASNLLCDTPSERERFTRERLLSILHGDVQRVITGLRRLRTTRDLRGEDYRRLTTIANYLATNSHRMCYDEYLRAGYPIATGVIEGACRHLVKDRMERSGMRWTLTGANALLQVRAIRESNLWTEFHATRREQETKQYHPHRNLVQQELAITI